VKSKRILKIYIIKNITKKFKIIISLKDYYYLIEIIFYYTTTKGRL